MSVRCAESDDGLYLINTIVLCSNVVHCDETTAMRNTTHSMQTQAE